jgi:hypothetical protein
MVVFVDLDDAIADGSAFLEKPYPSMVDPISDLAELPASPTFPNETKDILNPNRNGFSAALSCYPYVFAYQPASKNHTQLTLHSIASSRK